MLKPYFLFSILFFIVLTGCADDQLQPTLSLQSFQEEQVEKQRDQEEKKAGESWIQDQLTPAKESPSNKPVSPIDYTLGPGDLISIVVFETKDLNTEARVSSRGFVSLPLLNQVAVQGLTAAEAEEHIETLLHQKYLHNPHVTLFIKERVSQQITLVGALNQPGTYEFITAKTVLDMVALAGGLAKNAGDLAYITRRDSTAKNTKKVYLVDLYQLIHKGNIDMNMAVRGGDVIFVPKAGMVHVDGAVRKPGAIILGSEMTIDEAIANAGGLAAYADEDDIKLVRSSEDGERKIVQISMQLIRDSKDRTLLLRDNDVIFVEASGSKTFFSGFGFNLGFMGTGMRYDSPIK